ncbi:MAG: site-2 protease family protein [Terriglobales bacterium]
MAYARPSAFPRQHGSIKLDIRMTLQHVDILFQLIAFLFAISVHESAHAWTADRRGDPTARMLGRVTLNPIKHIDPVGTILLPLIAMLTHFPVIGWAKPTPVDPRNFKNPVLDDVLTSVAGPVSNFIVATGATIILAGIAVAAPGGRMIIRGALGGFAGGDSVLVPLSLLLYQVLVINVLLAVFNLIPIPPLDGSHVLRHFLSERVRQVYDTMGIFGLMALVFFGGNFLIALIRPVLQLYTSVLLGI